MAQLNYILKYNLSDIMKNEIVLIVFNFQYFCILPTSHGHKSDYMPTFEGSRHFASI